MKETQLIAQVCQNDSDALEQLVVQYAPLIQRVISRLYVRGFDRDDWLQEARICCLETCQKYDAAKGAQFGAFFKLRWENHVTSVVRKHMALKRAADRQAVSLENTIAAGHFPETDDLFWERTKADQCLTEMSQLWQQLNEREQLAWRYYSQDPTLTVADRAGYSAYQITRAKKSCVTKLRAYLNEHPVSGV